MNVSPRVLHLSLMLAMALPAAAALTEESRTAFGADNIRTPDSIQVAAGKGEAARFNNAGEADRLRHRVNEADVEQAVRQRLEKTDGAGDQLKTQDQLKTRDQLKSQDQLKIHDRLQDGSQSGDQQSSGEQNQPQFRFQDRYQFEEPSAGQGFNTSGSMVRQMGSGGAMSGGGTMSGGSSLGGGAHGGGLSGGSGRR